MNEVEATFCLHCERRPPVSALGLCAECRSVRGIRQLYVRRRGWTPAWEAHLRRLTERAKRRLPLFEDSPDSQGDAHESHECA